MNIEVGKQYRVEPKFKKSVVECEYFDHADKQGMIELAVCWRYGEYVVTPADEDEVQMLEDAMKNEDGDQMEVSAFSEWELISTFDGCSEDFYYHGTLMEEDEQEAFQEKYWEEGFEFLENEGWNSCDCEVYINNGINVEEWKGYSYERTAEQTEEE